MYRRTALSILLASACLTTVLPGRGNEVTERGAVADRGTERLLRLRARVRSKFLRKGGRIFPDGKVAPLTGGPPSDAGLEAGSSAPKMRVFSPEVQASRGVSGTQSETSIAVSGNRVVVGFNQINVNRGSGFAYSTDGGVTFTDSGGLPVGGAGSKTELLGDPSLTVCGDGTFYYASIYLVNSPNLLPSALAVNVGTFSGTTLNWTNPKVAVSSTNDFLDKGWLACDRTTNTLYMAYTRLVNFNLGGPLQVEIIKSTDGANTWTAPLILEASATESVQIPYLAIGPNSEVYVLWERGIDDITAPVTQLEFRRSFNFGAAFDPKVVVRDMTPSFFPANVGYNRESTLEIGAIAADTSGGPDRGNLYIIWVEREEPSVPERDVFLSRSTDQGATWSPPVRVNDDRPGNDQVMPWVSVNGAGVVEAFWYDYRNWAGMYTVDVYAARSLDGGRTFGPNFRVTTVPSSWFVPATFTPNFGDYIQCTSEAAGFYPSWADSRNNDIDVFVSHIATDTCGNGNLDPFEQCDDGNLLDGDSCSGACAATPCGNGVQEGAEQCDDGNIQSGDGCSRTCRLEVCGDNIVQPSNREECDDGNLTSMDGCSSTCQIEPDRMAFIADERSRLALMSVVNGRTIQIGDPGFHETGDLTFDASGRLFGATQYNPNLSIGFNGDLFSMPALGLPNRGALIGGTGWPQITAIDFHPTTGVLYAIAVDGPGASRLVTLNPATGATASLIGNLGLVMARAMAFDAAGTLYVSGQTTTVAQPSLYTVNLATAAKTLVGGPIYMDAALAGMDYAPDGTLYGIALRAPPPGAATDGGLLRIDKNTGAGTILFTTGRLNQQGIRFAPQVALDHDLDGIHDIADCAPFDPTNAPPGLTANLNFTDARTFIWSPASNARLHNTYRGTITAPLGTRLPGSVFDHTCLESDDSQANGDLVSSDDANPPAGSAFYYLAGGEGCGDGPLDSDPVHPIPIPAPCPTPP
jgi:cysteine-rich repeat protein